MKWHRQLLSRMKPRKLRVLPSLPLQQRNRKVAGGVSTLSRAWLLWNRETQPKAFRKLTRQAGSRKVAGATWTCSRR